MMNKTNHYYCDKCGIKMVNNGMLCTMCESDEAYEETQLSLFDNENENEPSGEYVEFVKENPIPILLNKITKNLNNCRWEYNIIKINGYLSLKIQLIYVNIVINEIVVNILDHTTYRIDDIEKLIRHKLNEIGIDCDAIF